jgi:hypothetical protein
MFKDYQESYTSHMYENFEISLNSVCSNCSSSCLFQTDMEAVKKCPFLAEVTPLVKEASKEMQDDVIDLTPTSESGK